MEKVAEFAGGGGPVLGICNGFQVLCEAGLLPGALLPNEKLRFLCRQVDIVVEETGSAWTGACEPGDRLSIPGFSGGCSGNPRNTSPHRPANGAAACAREVMRPPNDFPPAKRGRPRATRLLAVHTARALASATSARSGRALPAAMYGNSQRSVAMPWRASACAIADMNE